MPRDLRVLVGSIRLEQQGRGGGKAGIVVAVPSTLRLRAVPGAGPADGHLVVRADGRHPAGPAALAAVVERLFGVRLDVVRVDEALHRVDLWLVGLGGLLHARATRVAALAAVVELLVWARHDVGLVVEGGVFCLRRRARSEGGGGGTFATSVGRPWERDGVKRVASFAAVMEAQLGMSLHIRLVKVFGRAPGIFRDGFRVPRRRAVIDRCRDGAYAFIPPGAAVDKVEMRVRLDVFLAHGAVGMGRVVFAVFLRHSSRLGLRDSATAMPTGVGAGLIPAVSAMVKFHSGVAIDPRDVDGRSGVEIARFRGRHLDGEAGRFAAPPRLRPTRPLAALVPSVAGVVEFLVGMGIDVVLAERGLLVAQPVFAVTVTAVFVVVLPVRRANGATILVVSHVLHPGRPTRSSGKIQSITHPQPRPILHPIRRRPQERSRLLRSHPRASHEIRDRHTLRSTAATRMIPASQHPVQRR